MMWSSSVPSGLAISVVLVVAAEASAGLIDFEDLTVGTQYFESNVIVSNGVAMTLQGFPTGPFAGYITVKNLGFAGGTGNELDFFAGGAIAFDFGGALQYLSLKFGAYGGAIYVTVNGETITTFHQMNLPDTIGGVSVMVSYTGQSIGTVQFDGVIDTFAIGGAEFVLDDVSYKFIPSPGAGWALLIGLACARGRRRRIAE